MLWQAGALLLPAHSDPEAERALAGLGGPRCRCVELLDAWNACTSDPRVLMVGPRGTDTQPDPPALLGMLRVGVGARVLNAVRRWLPDARSEVVLELIPAIAERSLSGTATELTARLPLEWLIEVWAPGLDVVSGHFTLASQRRVSGTIELVTVDPGLTCHSRTLGPP